MQHLNQTTKTPSPVSEPTPDPIRDPLFSQSRLPSDVGIRPFGGIRSWRAQVVPTDRPLLGRFDRDTFQSCRQSSRPHESGRERTSASLFRVGARDGCQTTRDFHNHRQFRTQEIQRRAAIRKLLSHRQAWRLSSPTERPPKC